jgi:hypothetical protein
LGVRARQISRGHLPENRLEEFFSGRFWNERVTKILPLKMNRKAGKNLFLEQIFLWNVEKRWITALLELLPVIC